MDTATAADFALLTAALEAEVDDLVADYLARLGDELPEWTRDRPQFADTARIGAVHAIGAEVRALRTGRLPERCPPLDAEGARQCARLGVPLHAVVLQYRLGHAVQWEHWMRLVERHEPSDEERHALLEGASRFFFAYANRMTRFAIEEYTRERERLLRGREQHRVVLVRDLLDGRSVGPGALGYRPADHHVGLVASGEAAPDALWALASLLDRRPLIVRADESTWWAWLGGDNPLDGSAESALRRYRPPEGVRIGLGDQAAGVDGFRSTHAQAEFAHGAAVRRGRPLLAYDAVALEALACGDRAAAEAFVARELRGLERDDVRSRRLRATVRAYFEAGHNAAGAAAALGIHQQTVAQRLQAVEQRIGRSVVRRRAELETALRLRDHLRAEPPDRDGVRPPPRGR
ncbi:MAG TPA: helix-turn-helix domain-containing protein [Solirubrobacteraceae bacterium]|jgi:hypothetical protein|nr:helix-turn-helix domain-containing protein [Solirubrobacteraceae bacterium]